MKKILTTCTALLLVLLAFGQSSAGFWSGNNRADFTRPAFMPQAWRAHSLDLDAMRNHLRSAPMEFTNAAINSPLELALPMPDGTMMSFDVWESPIMEPALAEQFPMIKTYAGRSQNHAGTTLRIDISPFGFNAIVHTGTQTALVVPNNREELVYLSFWLKDVDLGTPAAQQFHCEVGEHGEDFGEQFVEPTTTPEQRSAVPVDLYTYRLAVATTAEYSVSEGGSQASVLAAVTNVISNVNSVFERDAAVRLVLIANTTDVFHYSNPDPYGNGNTQTMIEDNPDVLNVAFGVDGYDIGHVFGTNGGGLASLAGVCNDAVLAGVPKARAASCKFGPYDGPLFYIIAGHEMGHQFNATHTFNACDMDNETPETGYEPGSGSTIMCYNGNQVCGVNHIQATSDPYFHNNSMVRINQFTRAGGGAQCKTLVPFGNMQPEATIPMQGGFFIPQQTPFSLTGAATDPDDPNSALTYCWEQYDLGPWCILGQPEGTAPMFRSYPPVTTPTRIFPKIETIVNNATDKTEVLPFYDRVLTFRFTVRDNHVPPGAFNYDEIAFNATTAAGPFLVQYPNGGETFAVGAYTDVTWDVASTNLSPVNCQKVNIHLSTDGGYTYPTLLLANTPNDGTAKVVLPNLPTTTARIRVEAADNIFFDISNQNFTILAAGGPSYILTTNPAEGGIACDEFVMQVNTESLLGYNGQVNLSVGGPPVGISATFNPNPITAGQTSTMTVNTANATVTGPVQLNLLATSPGQNDQVRQLTINIVDTDLTGITASSPVDGASGQETLPDFAWTALSNADSYDFQISTDPSFATLVDSGTGLTSAEFALSTTLEDGQIYYWRVRGVNACGEGPWGDAFSFHTVAQECIQLSSTTDQNNINIPGTGLPLIESKINIAQSGGISDVNVKRVKATHSSLRDIELRLKHPDGNEVVLMSQPQCNSANINSGFDNQSPNALTNCPTANVTYQPVGNLSDFNGLDAQGEWKLVLEVKDTDGEGGTFENWELEVCAGLQSANPLIVKNDTLPVPPNGSRLVYTDHLLVTDADNLPSQLEFTIVTNTQHGFISKQGVQLGTGDHFTMFDVYASHMEYTNTNPNAAYDYFTFSVNDGGGGFAGTPRFNIKMDPNAPPSGTEEAAAGIVAIFPNPATSEVNVQLSADAGKVLAVELLDVQGRRLQVNYSDLGGSSLRLNTSAAAPGLYLVQVKTTEGLFAKKVVIQ